MPAGIEDFNKLIRFDETELMSNTTEAEFSITNRLYAKRGERSERSAELATLAAPLFRSELRRRGFRHRSGHRATRPQRGASSLQVTAFAFLDGPRRYSPVVSALRVNPLSGFGVEWRSDYDPLRRRPVNSVSHGRLAPFDLFHLAGPHLVRSGPQLSPSANQFRGMLTVGNDNRRGWNAAFSAIYDFRIGVMQFATTQVTYNTTAAASAFSTGASSSALETRTNSAWPSRSPTSVPSAR